MSDVHLKYRPEIDGLRAVAVLAVILFHGKVPGLSGGFVGVDIFFVISGYLITTIIHREIGKNAFSFRSFYERRARRILPALLVVLTVTAVAGWFLQGPYALVRLGQGLMAVTGFVSNILFWLTTNYFTAGLDNPLLHTWSLSVEEQFYVFFPILMMIVWRYARRLLPWVLVFCAVASLVASEVSVQTGGSLAAFYLLPTRAYELLIGAVAAVSPVGLLLAVRPRIRHGLGWIGVACITAALLRFDSSVLFPGLSALLPAVGCALVLLGASRDNVLGRLLSMRPLVAVGLISYSAYLWHQPVFTFAHEVGVGQRIRESAALTLLSLILGWASWRFVEQPFRSRERWKTRPAMWTLFVGSVAVFGLGLAMWVTQGAVVKYNEEQKRWQEYGNIEGQTPYVIDRFNSLEKAFEPGEQRRVLVVGDSQAQDFVNIAFEAGAWGSDQVRTVYIPAVCQPVWVDEDVSAHVPAADRHLCLNARTLENSLSQIQQADIIFLVANWHEWSATRLRRSIQRLQLRGDQRLFVLGPKQFAAPQLRKMMAMTAKDRASVREMPSAERVRVNKIVRDGVAGLGTFVDVLDAICSSKGCPTVTSDDELISYDRIHLTRGGARFIGPLLFEGSALREFVAQGAGESGDPRSPRAVR